MKERDAMVVVEYSYEEMRRLVDLPLERMVASLNELGAPSEYEPGVKKIITELTPNRPDWYSMEGLSRALKAYHGGKHPEYSTKKSSYNVVVDQSVSKIRPFTACAVVKGLKFNDQRIRDIVLLQEKLLGTLGRKVKKFGLGLYPLDAISFPVRYTTMKPKEIRYIPLGFDHELTADEILAQHKKGEQYGHIIKGADRYPVFVDAKDRIMALIPIVNSNETGRIDESTEDIFIEVSGTDIHSCKAALNILVCTFADMGGTVYEVEVDYGKSKLRSPDLESVAVEIDLERINKTLGLGLKEKDVAKLLSKMGYSYRKGCALVPPYRADVISWVDVMEDIAIAHGYNNFEMTLPAFFTVGKVDSKLERMDEAMRGMGFLEMKTFILTNKELLSAMGYNGGLLEISNPGTTEYTVVRPSLRLDVIGAFATNKMKGLPQRFYEIGNVHDGKHQERCLAFGIMDKKLDFSQIRGYLQAFAKEQGFNFKLEKEQNPLFDKEISCTIISKGKKIGVFGKVTGSVLERYGISFDVYVCEIEVG